jgi:hypothetical protein
MYMRHILALTSAAFFAALVLVMSGCAKSGSSTALSPQLSLSDAESRYGLSPSRSTDITLQPDVVTIDNGPEAVHNVSADGLTWTFDANAPHAQDVAPGKVLFLTSRAVGRVLGVQRTGNDLSVTLGPIAITDLIKEADITTDQPIDLNAMTAYVAQNYPEAPIAGASPQSYLPASPNNVATSVQVLRIDPSGNAFGVPAALAAVPPSPVDISNFNVTPFCCGGIGLKIERNTGGTIIKALVVIKVSAPSLHFNLKISGGTVKTSTVQLNGVAGLAVHYEAGDTTGLHGNINTPPIMVPVDISWPINLHPPFAMTLHQSFIVKTAFTSKNSTFLANGDWSFTGSFSMGYDNGSWGVSAPTSFTTNQSLLNSITGVAVGPEAVELSYQAKIIVGVGAFGFVTGPYLGYTSSFGMLQQGAVGIPCHGADLGIGMNVGIGYSIPQPINKAINAVLHALNLSPVNGTGGISHPLVTLISKKEDFPAHCAGY